MNEIMNNYLQQIVLLLILALASWLLRAFPGSQATSRACSYSPRGISPLPWQVGQVTKPAPAALSQGTQEKKGLLLPMLE